MGRNSAANPYIAAVDVPETLYFLCVNLAQPNVSLQDVKLTVAEMRILLGVLSPAEAVPLATQTADYAAVPGDASKVIPFDCTAGPLTCTLPDPADVEGKVFRPVKIDSSANELIIVCDGTGEVNNGDVLAFYNQREGAAFQSNGVDYVPYY